MEDVFALDVGEKRIGVARANKVARVAEPLVTLANEFEFPLKLQALIDQHQAGLLIVGMPRNLSGEKTAQSATVEAFIARNLHSFSVPIIWQDESLTSVKAEERLRKSKKPYEKSDIDKMAAAIILEDYLLISESDA